MRSGLRTRQQQPRHAVGQRMRLAGAGIGGDPGGWRGIGSGDGRIGAHSLASSQPLDDHSRTRAR